MSRHRQAGTRVPYRGSDSVSRLCERILGTTDFDPVFLKVKTRGDTIPNECFGNVDAAIASSGGSVVYGWRLWEWPRVYIEGEFHAVWQTPSGKLVEVSRNSLNSPHVLFLPDPTRTFEGKSVPSHRLALTDDPLIAEWFALLDRRFALLNEGERATTFGAIEAPEGWIPLEQRLVEIQLALIQKGY